MAELEPEGGLVVRGVVKENRRITPESADEVRRLLLYVDEPAFRVVQGQSIAVRVPGPHDFGNRLHVRRYTISGCHTVPMEEGIDIELMVRRCFYLDEVSGEQYPGIASNYLCDAAKGEQIELTGPYRNPFRMPLDTRSNLLMIGTGTGVAPFRAFVRHIYSRSTDWKGKVRVFYGARTGMDLLYLNEVEDDLANYYDEATFKAFRGLVSKPLAGDEHGLQHTLEENAAEAWALVQDPNTHVYLAGLTKTLDALDRAMAKAAGSAEAWTATRDRLQSEGRWSELLYS